MAQGGSAAPSDTLVAMRKCAHAARISGPALRLDGRLDESAWRAASFVADFVQKDPNEGAPPREATEVAFLYDDDALWIGARMHSDDPDAIRRLVSRRDQPGNTERIIISLDTYCDRRTAYSFTLSVSGVRSDYYHPGDDEYDRDFSYDPVWSGRTAVDSAGWTAEVRIPFSQLRFNQNATTWGVNLNRWIPQRNEDDYWVYVPKTSTGWASRFGDLDGLEGIRPRRRFELLPYVASDATISSAVDAADPFHDGTEVEGRAGADLKMGLGPNLTLDGTVNPDFGQVDADPAEINLTQFETFFPERRPFFIEGSQLLSGNGPGYFYSRRIGAPPPGLAFGDFVDRPEATTILAATKLTGRLASGTSIGGLAALTDREYATTYSQASGATDRTRIVPRTGWGVLRLQQEFGASKSTAGLSLTAVSRALEAGDPLANRLSRHAYSGGGDALLRFRGGMYEISSSAGFSWVEGTSTAMQRLQLSSARYYQRPDAGHVQFDPTRTSLPGWTANASIEKKGGSNWLWGAGTNIESPGFELNDAGSLSSADDIDNWAMLRYRQTRPGSIFRDYDLRLYGFSDYNFGGVNKGLSSFLETHWTWKNFLRTNVGINRRFDSLSDDFTRGGPLFLLPSNWGIETSLASNFAKTTQWEIANSYYWSQLGGWSESANALLGTRLGDHWQLSVAPALTLGQTGRQYVAVRPGGPEATFGGRYIFAELEQSTLRAQFRATYAFTPNVTLEAYAEPFASTGRWDHFGELRAARSNDLLAYGTEGTTIERHPNDDLTITDGADSLFIPHQEYLGDFEGLSFRSNVVLRWEWRPGSTLFCIWQQNRADFFQSSELVQPGDLWDAATTEGDHFFALKATYWLPID